MQGGVDVTRRQRGTHVVRVEFYFEANEIWLYWFRNEPPGWLS